MFSVLPTTTENENRNLYIKCDNKEQLQICILIQLFSTFGKIMHNIELQIISFTISSSTIIVYKLTHLK